MKAIVRISHKIEILFYICRGCSESLPFSKLESGYCDNCTKENKKHPKEIYKKYSDADLLLIKQMAQYYFSDEIGFILGINSASVKRLYKQSERKGIS